MKNNGIRHQDISIQVKVLSRTQDIFQIIKISEKKLLKSKEYFNTHSQQNDGQVSLLNINYNI